MLVSYYIGVLVGIWLGIEVERGQGIPYGI